MNTTHFYGNGKLLLSGEYAVLDGALAWAIPTKFGQHLQITPQESQQLCWKSIDEKGTIWFQGTYTLNDFETINASDKDTSKALQKILKACKNLNPNFLVASTGFKVTTTLTFARDWGLGSSSTLIYTVAQWANVNAYELLAQTFGGSGYDIACAQHNTPILFKINNNRASVEEVRAYPAFTDALFFIHLNKKKNSRDAIHAYRQKEIDKKELTKAISLVTKKMIECKHLTEFELLLTEHEQLLSQALGVPTIKTAQFADYTGAIKSLGGWGGDFIMATGNSMYTPTYFKNKGYHTVLSFDEMSLPLQHKNS